MQKLVEFNKFETQLQEFKDKYDDVVYDMDDKKQNKQARSDQRSIGTIVAELNRTHKELKAPLLEKTREIDAKRNQIKDDLQGVQTKIKDQIKIHEDKQKAHEDALNEKFNNIRSFKDKCMFANTSTEIEELLTKLVDISIDASFEHLQEVSEEQREQIITELKETYGRLLKSEKDAVELAELRAKQAKQDQIDRDRVIAENAAREAREQVEAEAAALVNKAKAEAELAIQEKKRAEAKIEEQKAQAVAQERLRVEREEAEARAEEAAKKAKINAAKAKKAHVNKICREARDSLTEQGFHVDVANSLIALVRDGKIKNISLNY